MRSLPLLSPFALLSAAGVTVACGSATDPGSGSNTLLALVEVQATDVSSQAELRLTANGNPILGANVVFVDADQDANLTSEMPQAGNYRMTVNRYVRTMGLRVVAADDDLKAQLQGPAPHTVSRPPNGAVVRRGDFTSLRVEWTAEETAEEVRVILGREDISLPSDDGFAEVPLEGLADGPHTVTVLRATSVELAGGVSGSSMRISYASRADFRLE